MALFLAELFLLSTALLVIAYPLIRSEAAGLSGPSLMESEYSDLLYKKEAAYTALVDLEFDFKTGKIGDDDYKIMKAGFESDALNLLRQVEDYEKGRTPVSPQKAVDTRFCNNCGSTVRETNKFCAECGARL